MDREQIFAMEPGHELDELVAGRVMGWRVFGSKINKNGFIAYMADFKPTTNMAVAWEVVDKMHEWGGCVIGCYGKGEQKWFTVETETDRGCIKVTAHTVQEAICKAALLAVFEQEIGGTD